MHIAQGITKILPLLFARSVKNQKLILEGEELSPVDKTRFSDEAKIVVSTERTFEAAAGYAGQKVAVHNFASATNPGGGVTRGSSAQEECLCRCSGLYFCLSVSEMMKGFYYPHRNAKNPINNADIIYTPDVTVFKTDTNKPKLMDEKDWYEVDVITCAAPNLRERPSNWFNQGNGDRAVKVSDRELLEIHKKRLTRILDVAVLNGDEVVILGAFGCGAFQLYISNVGASTILAVGSFIVNMLFAEYTSAVNSSAVTSGLMYLFSWFDVSLFSGSCCWAC